MNIGSKNRLTEKSAALFTTPSLFDEIARTVCKAGVLPRKELYESWQFAKRVAKYAQCERVVDLCAGHGLVAPLLLLLGAANEAVSVERAPPKSAEKIRAVLRARWPNLRWHTHAGDLVEVALRPGDLVTAVHACGALTDRIIERATQANANVAVMPCCQDIADVTFVRDWLCGPLAVDARRAFALQQSGYRVFAHHIDPEITPQNRVLVAIRENR